MTPLRRSVRGRKHATPPKASPRRRLGYESLEDRRLLAVDISLTNSTVAENAVAAVIGDVLVDEQATAADKVTVMYQAHIATISGTPFGFDSSARTEIVTGSFTYDRTTGDVSPADTSRGNYPHLGGGGAFQATVLGTTITGSATPYVQIEHFGAGVSDTFRYIDGPRSIGNQGGVMTVNGTARQDVQLTIAFTDGSGNAFTNDSLPFPLPFAVAPLSQPSPFFFPHTFSLKDNGGTMLLQLDSISMADNFTLSVSDSRFEIINGKLKLATGQSLDHESEPTLTLDIIATDSGGTGTTKPFVITVGNVNEAPQDVQLSRTNAFAGVTGAWIASVTAHDPDIGDTHTFTVSDARFIVVGGNLYLKSGQTLNQIVEPSVALTITALDNGSPKLSHSQNFVLTVKPSPGSWNFAYQWKPLPEDVNADGLVTPLDVLLIVVELNANGPSTLSPQTGGKLAPNFYDVSGDNIISPLDAARVITYLNAVGSEEGEPAGASQELPPIAPLLLREESQGQSRVVDESTDTALRLYLGDTAETNTIPLPFLLSTSVRDSWSFIRNDDLVNSRTTDHAEWEDFWNLLGVTDTYP